MRFGWGVLAAALGVSISAAALSAEDARRNEPEIDIFASMTGNCSALSVGDREFSCAVVAFSHSPGGRSGFTVPLLDPDDDTHMITFSGEKSKRLVDNVYELFVDQMLLKSKDRPKMYGLPIPAVELSTGTCKQVGNFAAQQVSSVTCIATDEKGKKYAFRFESDGSPIKVMMISVVDAAANERRSKVLAAHMLQQKCQQKAVLEGVLPRDRTTFILQCMEE
jgi:hypothetical protein